LNGLIFLGDPDKITELLYEKHSGFLHPDIVSPKQIKRFVERLLIYLQNQIADYEKNQQLQMEYENENRHGEDFDRDMEDGDVEEQGHYNEGDSENIDELLHDF